MKLKEGFRMRKLCGEKIVTAEGLGSVNFNKMIVLNDTAAFLWESLYGKEFDVEEMARLLTGKYDVKEELALKDSEALVVSWRDAGVLDE